MLEELNDQDRTRLLQFVCSFAWADLEVSPEERKFVAELMERLRIEPEDKRRVRQWLQVPPSPDDVDPTAIPLEQRQLFYDAALGMIEADGRITPEERESFALFEALLR